MESGAKPLVPPTDQRFSKLQKIFDILFLDGDLATKCRADLTKILSKFVLDICMISQPRRMNLVVWILPFDFLKAALSPYWRTGFFCDRKKTFRFDKAVLTYKKTKDEILEILIYIAKGGNHGIIH